MLGDGVKQGDHDCCFKSLVFNKKYHSLHSSIQRLPKHTLVSKEDMMSSLDRKSDGGTEACVGSQMAHLHQLMTRIKISSLSKCLSLNIWGQLKT